MNPILITTLLATESTIFTSDNELLATLFTLPILYCLLIHYP
jgi:hypothetical protein